jgi:hypothetical protein
MPYNSLGPFDSEPLIDFVPPGRTTHVFPTSVWDFMTLDSDGIVHFAVNWYGFNICDVEK